MLFCLFNLILLLLSLHIVFWAGKIYSICKKYKETNHTIQPTKDSVKTLGSIFRKIYDKNYWGVGSGTGSYKECTENYLKFLKVFIESHPIKKIIDLGCGDWQMLKHFNFSNDVKYYGYDVVKHLVEKHNITFRRKNINFYLIKGFSDRIENGDLIISKDVLQHLENRHVIYFLTNILPKYKYGIVVNDFKSNNKNIITNADINSGSWRPLDLEISPFFTKEFTSHQDMFFCTNYKRIYIKS